MLIGTATLCRPGARLVRGELPEHVWSGSARRWRSGRTAAGTASRYGWGPAGVFEDPAGVFGSAVRLSGNATAVFGSAARAFGSTAAPALLGARIVSIMANAAGVRPLSSGGLPSG